MGTLVGSGKDAIWLREIRKLTESGHQTSIISTCYDAPAEQIAPQMFNRWRQENFFRYMMEHFGIDLLQEYGVDQIHAAERVINPRYRELDRQRNSIQNKLRYRRANFAELTLHPATDSDPEKYDKWLKKKADLLEEIEQAERELAELKIKFKETPKHITLAQL
jgi:hypothetical protein